MKMTMDGMVANSRPLGETLESLLASWEVSIGAGQGQWLYMTQEVSQKQPGWEGALCGANIAVLDAILEELIKLRNPAAQDTWTTVKNVMAKAVADIRAGRLD
jgi:hypothetical protein